MTAVRYPGAWHAAVDHLCHLGVEVVFGLPPDDVAVLRALEPTDVRMVLCRDQRTALFMATGYALQSGRVGVCVIGKGPAVTNALSGLLEAHASGVPLVVLAAGTGVDRQGSGAFQELDQLALVTPLVRWSQRVDHPDRVVPALEKAFLAATAGRPGPVYLELPDHLAATPVTRSRPWSAAAGRARPQPSPDEVAASLARVQASRRPVLLLGGGLRHAGAADVVDRLAERIGAAVFTTASGRGAIDEASPWFCGLSGLYSTSGVQELWRDADLVIALGSRLEETATLGWKVLGDDVDVLQVNIDRLGMSTEYAGLKVTADAGLTAEAWLRALRDHPRGPDPSWAETVGRIRDAAWREAHDRVKGMRESEHLHVAEVLAALDTVAPAARILVQENGLQDMWSYFYPYWSCGLGGSVVPSEQTSLGFGAAAAAGVWLAARERPVVAFVGDGAFGVLGHDLGTVVRERIGVLYVVLRNGGFGWLQSQLDAHADGESRFRFVSDEQGGARHPCVWQTTVRGKQELERTLSDALAVCEAGLPAVVDVPVRLDDVAPGISQLAGAAPG